MANITLLKCINSSQSTNKVYLIKSLMLQLQTMVHNLWYLHKRNYTTLKPILSLCLNKNRQDILAALIGTKHISQQNPRPSFFLRNSNPTYFTTLLFYLELLTRHKQKVVQIFVVSVSSRKRIVIFIVVSHWVKK